MNLITILALHLFRPCSVPLTCINSPSPSHHLQDRDHYCPHYTEEETEAQRPPSFADNLLAGCFRFWTHKVRILRPIFLATIPHSYELSTNQTARTAAFKATAQTKCDRLWCFAEVRLAHHRVQFSLCVPQGPWPAHYISFSKPQGSHRLFVLHLA